MNPIIKLWMFENWAADRNEQLELAKNHAYLLGSFWNPEAVRKLTGQGTKTYASTDKDLEKTLELVKNYKPQEPIKKNKKRTKIKR